MKQYFWTLIVAVLAIGCGDEGRVDMTLPISADQQTAPRSPSLFTPLTMREVINNAIRIKYIRGRDFTNTDSGYLRTCYVMYRYKRKWAYEPDAKYVRLSNSSTSVVDVNIGWTHNGVNTPVRVFMFDDGSLTERQWHDSVHFRITGLFEYAKSGTWHLHLKYIPSGRTPVGGGETPKQKHPDSRPIETGGEAVSIEQLATLVLEHRERLYGTQKILTTTLRITEKGRRGGRHWVRVEPTGRSDLRIFITSATDAFDSSVHYAYVRVAVERFLRTGDTYALWLRHIDD